MTCIDFQVMAVWSAGYPGLLAMALPKNSPLKRFLWEYMLAFQERGDLSYLRQKWDPAKPKCLKDEATRSTGISKLFTLFLLIPLGLLLGFLTLIFELFQGHAGKKEPIELLNTELSLILHSSKQHYSQIHASILSQNGAALKTRNFVMLAHIENILHSIQYLSSKKFEKWEKEHKKC